MLFSTEIINFEPMKTKTLLPLFAGITLITASCGQKSPKKQDEASAEKDKTCFYTYAPGTTKVSWTAYKFTEKVGVKGGFDSIYVDNIAKMGSVSDVFGTASFRVPVASLNTVNPDRDAKIRKFFFGSLINPTELTGKVLSVKGDDNSGVMTCQLNMNAREQKTEMKYYLSGDTLILNGDINVEEWGAGPGIIRLNRECAALHTGPDGKGSKLWPDVKLEIRTILSRTCE